MLKSTHAMGRGSRCCTLHTQKSIYHDVASDRPLLQNNVRMDSSGTPPGQYLGWDLSSFLLLLDGVVVLWHRHGHLAVGYAPQDGAEGEDADPVLHSPRQDIARHWV